MTQRQRRSPQRVPPLDDGLLAAYRATRFVVSLPDGELAVSVGKRCKELGRLLKRGLHDHGCIVTAYNPFSSRATARTNRSAQSALRTLLARRALEAWPARGEDPAGNWPPEPSYFVPGATFADADQWTRMFDQHAVVMVDAWGYATLRFHPGHRRGGYVYVVRLSDHVWDNKKFRDRNPERNPRKPCVYVGSTGTSPESRFQQARKGIKAGRRFVTEYGVDLLPRHYTKLNPCLSKEREAVEKALAERLRRRGFGVWCG